MGVEKRDQDHLDLCRTPIDEQFDTGDKTAVIRREERDGFSDFVRIAQPPHRHGAHEVRLELLITLPQATTNPLKPGVSVEPGLMALTRILRCFRSTVQERANDRMAALVAL